MLIFVFGLVFNTGTHCFFILMWPCVFFVCYDMTTRCSQEILAQWGVQALLYSWWSWLERTSKTEGAIATQASLFDWLTKKQLPPDLCFSADASGKQGTVGTLLGYRHNPSGIGGLSVIFRRNKTQIWQHTSSATIIAHKTNANSFSLMLHVLTVCNVFLVVLAGTIDVVQCGSR